MPPDDKRETADAFTRAFEAEIAEKRAQWQRDRDKHRLVRLLGFSFLSLIILGGLIAFFVFFSRAEEMRTQQRRPVSAPHASP